jgi:CHAD domain-containing protein
MKAHPEATAGGGAAEPGRSALAAELDPMATAAAGPDEAVTRAVQRSLAAPVLRLIAHDDAVRAGEDPEAIHQARVATRRLRANLGTLHTLMQPEVAERLRVELAWLGGALGDVRDLDVLLIRLRARSQRLASRDAHAAKRLLAGLAESRAESHAALMDAFRSPRYDDLLRACAAALRSIPASDERAADAFRPLMDKQWRRLRRAFERLTPESSDAKLHAARIATKRARYAAEAFAPVYEGHSRGFLRRAGALQDVLGEHQDAVAAQAWLRRKASHATPAVAFVAGELVAEEARARTVARASWPGAWHALSRARLRFWT